LSVYSLRKLKTMKLYPFHQKELPDIQKKLFRRAHGIEQQIVANGNTVIEFTIPYNWVKITTMEVVGLPERMKADLTIHDSVTGAYSQTGISKFQLNQFGYNVNITEGYYRDHSEYDADLYIGMIVRVTIKNHTSLTPTIGVNLTLHEVV
jgi:hypothetical protein